MTTYDLMCFDRFLPDDDLSGTITHGAMSMAAPGALPEGMKSVEAAWVLGKTWANGSRLKVRFLNGTASEQAFVRQYAVEWTRAANLDFEFSNAGTAEIRIGFGNTGSWSYIGTDATHIPLDQPTMNFGWQAAGTVLHEFGHALGMIHEHQNPRSNPVIWNEQAVINYFAGAPNYWSASKTRQNVIERYSHTVTNGSNFDASSIMLYAFPASLTTNGVGTHANNALSATDLAVIQQMYPGRGAPPLSTSQLRLDGPVRGEIAQAGEEDIYTFEAQSAGTYRFETQGSTDVTMTLFGPDNVQLGYNDDGGGQSQALIQRQLMAGTYRVRIGHYSLRGTGQYSLTVKRQ